LVLSSARIVHRRVGFFVDSARRVIEIMSLRRCCAAALPQQLSRPQQLGRTDRKEKVAVELRTGLAIQREAAAAAAAAAAARPMVGGDDDESVARIARQSHRDGGQGEKDLSD
jgi:hypothetical protein